MSKRMTRVLSLILTLVMFVSVSTPAFAWGGGDLGKGWDRDIGEDEIRDFVPEEEIVEEDEPLDYFQTDGADGRQVTVEAPMGSLPRLAELRAEMVEIEDVREAVESVVVGEANILLAMDISFWMNGIEIEPEEPVRVKISAPELDGQSNLTLVHIPDAAEPETVDLIDDEDLSFALGTNEIAFEADSFSVYAVIGSGETASVKVTFVSKEDTIATMYVKNSDTAEELQTIVYDPGAGDLAPGERFLGWTTEQNYNENTTHQTIDEIRADLEALDITADTQPITYYAVIGKTITLTYLDENGIALSSVSRDLVGSDAQTDFTVDQNYVAIGETNFEGWNVKSGDSGNIVKAVDADGATVAPPYPNGTVLTLKASVTLTVFAPEGHWFIFDENGKGATYNAARFLKDGEVTARPRPDSEMLRNGYTFGGWYQEKECINPFTFGNTISERTTIYAKWTPVSSANYYVIIWRQNLDGDGYDYADTITLSGTPDTTINTIASNGTGNDAYATVNGTAYRGADNQDNNPYTGFHLKEIVYPKKDDNTDDRTIHAEGNTIVNIYYDRNEYTLNFQVQGYTYTPTTSNNGTQYGYYNGEYVRIYYNNGTWYRTRTGGGWGGYSYSNPYTGPRYTQSYGWATIKEIKALFGQDISGNFPIVGTNGVTYDHGERWKPQTPNSMNWSEVMVYIDTMPHANVTFHYDDEGPSTALTMNYYVEALPDDPNQVNAPSTLYNVNNNAAVSAGGKKFILYKAVKANYNWVTIEDIVTLSGFTILGTDSRKDSDSWISTGGTLNIYYTRDSYRIKYNDGAYLDGNGNVLSEPTQGDMGQSALIPYGSDISSYNKGGANYKDPTPPAGYVFEGWYLDNKGVNKVTFETMPKDGLVVYATWRQIQYRVFLRPNAGTDSTLNWGNQNQEMNFRITFGEKVDCPEGRRNEYEFGGWFTDPAFKNTFNDDVVVLNDESVTTAYDKTLAINYTDPMDKWGNGATMNKDVDRFWITKKLDLYALWRAKFVGAEGLGIVYDANGGKNAPSDLNLYKDQAWVVAQAASTAPDDSQVFLKWEIMDGSSGTYTPTGNYVVPGSEFQALKSLCLVTEMEGSTDTNPKFSYTIQLRAVYGEKEIEKPTDLTWYSNVQDRAGIALDKNKFVTDVLSEYSDKGYFLTIDKGADGDLKINEPVDIPAFDLYAYPGYTFLGWAKLDKADDPHATITTLDQIDADNLFLKWVPGLDGADGHYEAKNAAGNYVTVTQVAADERDPHQMLVAVWQAEFYVYHSGVDGGKIETITIMEPTYNLTQNVTKGTLYGGYFLKGDFDAPTMENGVPTTDCAAYDGLGNWTWKTAQTVSGLAITPAPGETYYIKEVPANIYLKPYFRYTYHQPTADDPTSNGQFGSAWTFLGVDDVNYLQAGFIIVDSAKKATICKTIKLSAVEAPEKVVELTAKSVYNASDDARLGYLEVYNEGDKVNLMSGTSRVYQYWKTKDGVFVTGTFGRTYEGVGSIHNLTCEQFELSSFVGSYSTVLDSVKQYNPAQP